MSERECGGCTMCCKLPGIVDPELTKQINAWCQHCNIGKGCRIYDTRPKTCKDFACMWLVSPEMPEDMRPDRSKLMFTALYDKKHKDVFPENTLLIWEGVPGAFDHPKNKKLIDFIITKGVVIRLYLGGMRRVNGPTEMMIEVQKKARMSILQLQEELHASNIEGQENP